MKRLLTLLLLALSFGSLSSACALLRKSSPQVPRYFTPQYEETGPSAAPAQPALRVRLGRVSAVSNLRERVAYRISEREVRYYENRRWTERPASYLEHALARSLFERHGLTAVLSGNAPTLEVELTAFEEITGAPPHRVRVEVRAVLQHDTAARLYETIRVEELVPAADDEAPKPEAVVQALSKALRGAVERVAERTTTTLSAIAAEVASAETGASDSPP